MALAVERSDARSWADSDLEPLFEGAFPAFITADQEAKAYIGRVRDWFAGLGIIVTEDGQTPVATGWAGGTIIAAAPRSETMTGTVAEWESWTGMAFPATGDYVIPRGLSILHIDTVEDSGTYTEPNVWVRHP